MKNYSGKIPLSLYDNIEYSYTIDRFNQSLKVKLIGRIPISLHASYMKEAVLEAYDHYNHTHPNDQFIHPDSIISD